MANIIEMPKLSDTMEEGVIANWVKQEGDVVEEGEVLVEIETDKATMEYESPFEGKLIKILKAKGEVCDLNQPIAVVADEGESVDLDAILASSSSKPSASTPNSETEKSPTAKTATQSTVAVGSNGGSSKTSRGVSSPLARRIASERGLDIDSISGSGPNGRVVQKDVLEFDGSAENVGVRSRVTGGAMQADSRVPVSMMRKTIAKRLSAAKNDAPHFYLTTSANLDGLFDWRARLNSKASESAAKVSVNDLAILATARALREHPLCNASWDVDSIIHHGSVNIAMAVALEEGLVTPVLRNTDLMGVKEISERAKALGAAARDGRLSNEDFSGGTFTISNLGMFGIEEFTAIINPPQSCILALGAAKLEAVVAEDGSIVSQRRMKMTLSCDHRVVDGSVGAKFLKTLVSYLEDPLLMLA